MDKKFWDTIGLIVIVSNALGIIVLFEMIFFKFPYISIFVVIFYFVLEMNKKMFKVKSKAKIKNPKQVDQALELDTV
ncbi:MAG: hypothetical protein NTV98_06290 [Candidatus Roizmanbacteria bacterium]|nr:hypothetical protein [Candidatus Roizmanbacteria bacterium]